MRRVKGVLFSLVIAGLSACNSQTVFEQNNDIASGYWAKEEIQNFDFEILDTDKSYNIFYNIRYTVAYPFHNIYLTYTLRDKNGTVITSDLQNMDLFDKKTGEPIGSGLGDLFDLQVLSLKNQKFPKVGKYSFSIQQFMRKDSLPEIYSVGIRVEYSE